MEITKELKEDEQGKEAISPNNIHSLFCSLLITPKTWKREGFPIKLHEIVGNSFLSPSFNIKSFES
jgi:hypothetical protein